MSKPTEVLKHLLSKRASEEKLAYVEDADLDLEPHVAFNKALERAQAAGEKPDHALFKRIGDNHAALVAKRKAKNPHGVIKGASEQPKAETAAQVDNNASANSASKSEMMAGSSPAKAPNDKPGDGTKDAPKPPATKPDMPAQVENNEAMKLKTADLHGDMGGFIGAHPRGVATAAGGVAGAGMLGVPGLVVGGAAGLLKHILSKKDKNHSLLGDVASGAGIGGLVGAGLGGATGAKALYDATAGAGSKVATEQTKVETEAQVPNNAPANSAAKSEMVAGSAPEKAPNSKGESDGTKDAPAAPVKKPDVKGQVENNESNKKGY